MQTELQIAQKIHACLTPLSVRGHDLYDIYKMLEVSRVDFTLLARLVRQTFDARARHVWHTSFSPSNELKVQYLLETEEIAQARSFDEALEIFASLLLLIDDEMKK
jgi:predicted nucleotidyltransferase component of viral defense system